MNFLNVPLEHFYTLPNPTANECRMYAYARELREGLDEGQGIILDLLLDVCIECICDAAEDGFIQGLRAGVLLASI